MITLLLKMGVINGPQTANQNGYMTTGMIMMWYGTIATIPSGWALCNGSNSTPDLRNRFIVGANADASGVAKSTVSGSALQTGGAATININHSHEAGGLTTDPTSELFLGAGGDIAAGGDFSSGVPQASDTLTGFTSSGLSESQSVLNPFYALAFIMKL